MPIGYAQVSIADQELILQIEALAYAQKGDVLRGRDLCSLDRALKKLLDLSTTLASRQADLRMLTTDIDTQTASGRFFFARHKRHQRRKVRSYNRQTPIPARYSRRTDVSNR
jgi:ABC-type transporter Mla subunit MlaD